MAETIQRSFTKGELAPALHARADLRAYATGAKTLRNFFVHPEGGASTRSGFKWAGHVKDNKATFRLIPFSFNTEQNYVLEFTDYAMRVIKDCGYVVNSPITIIDIQTGSLETPGTTVTTASAHGFSTGDQVYISGVVGMTEINNAWYTITVVDSNSFTLDGVVSASWGNYISGGTVSGLYTVTSPFAEADLAGLKFTQSADVMTFVHPDYDVRELTRTSHTSWTFSTVSYAPTISAPTVVTVAHAGGGCGSYNKTYEYVVTAVDADGVESVASSMASSGSVTSLSATCSNRVTWNTVTGADHYNVYKTDSPGSGVYGWIGKSETLSFYDYNIAPSANGPPIDRQPFSSVDDKPSTVNYYQQRLMFAATNNKPQTVYTSQSGNYHSLRVSEPTQDDDAVTFTIASQKVNEIRHIIALDALILLTSGGEWKVTEGQNDVLTPASVGVKPQSYYGSSDVAPVVIGNTAVYIQERGSRVRDIGYTFETDTYTGNDLSILAQHLFDNHTIIDMAYSQEPYSQMFLVRDDGVLLCCTYHKQHQVNAWYTFDSPNALVKSIAVIASGDTDVLYIGVERTINGSPQRFVECMKPRDWTTAEDAFCVDSGLTYSGTATTTIYGLNHLEGETVVALADGNIVNGLTVTDGAVTLPTAASTVHVGLAYTCDLETLPIDSNQNVVRGKKKTVSEVVLTFQDTRGGWLGPNVNSLTEIKPRYESDSYDSIALKSSDVRQAMSAGWTQDGNIFFRQVDPLPATILAIAPELSIG